MSQAFSYQRGAPISVDLVIADPAGYDPASLTVMMRLKIAISNAVPPKTQAQAAVFSVSYVPPSGGQKGYWQGVISGATSAALGPGLYVTDGQIMSGVDTIEVTQPQLIRIKESVTPV